MNNQCDLSLLSNLNLHYLLGDSTGNIRRMQFEEKSFKKFRGSGEPEAIKKAQRKVISRRLATG